jgi:hypothetical protein
LKIKFESFNRVCNDTIQYYLMIQSESHRDSWDDILLLMLTKILKLDSKKVIFFLSISFIRLTLRCVILV